MTAPRLLLADLSGDDPVSFRGFLDTADPAIGIKGWAVDLAHPARAVSVELCAGETVIATAPANLRREDFRRFGFGRRDVGFRFAVDDLRARIARVGLAADARLRIRVSGTDLALRSDKPLPTPGDFLAAAEPAGQEVGPAAPSRAAAIADEPAIEAVAQDIGAALPAMADRAAGLLRAGRARGAGRTAGHIECVSRRGEDGLVWLLGWMGSDLPPRASVAVAADGVEHPSALVVAWHDGRTDLPEGASGILGLLRTDWRPDGGGGARLLFLDGASAGAQLRLSGRPKLLTADDYADWAEQREGALGGPFAESLRSLLARAAETAPDSFRSLMKRGARLRADGDHRAALDLFHAALALEPRSARARLAAAGALRGLGHEDEADEACRAVLADEPGNAEALMSLGHSLRGRGDSAGALPLFQAALASEPLAAWARMAVADTLADLHRLEEAEEACRAVLADEPDNFGALMSLGHMAKAKADRRAGLAWFERAARAAPDAPGPRFAMADALRDLGDFGAAREVADALLARAPDSFEAWMSLGHTERRAGRRAAALEAFSRASELKPGTPGPLIQMAVEERRLGRPEACERLLARAVEADGDDPEALLQLGEHLRAANRLDEALGVFRRAIASRRTTFWAYLAASQVLVDTGEFGQAMRTLDEGEARLGAKPEFAAKRSELLRRTGDWPAALAVVEGAEQAWPRHFGVWFERASLERLRGGPGGVAERAGEAPVGNTFERARVHLLLGLEAADRWRFDEAQEHYARSIELNEDDGWPRICLAQTRLLQLDIEGAREQLRAVSRLDSSAAKLQGRSTNISQTHLGQLLDEFVLDRQALDELRALRGLPLGERVGPLLALAARFPDYTPAAIALLTALRQSGRLEARPAAEAPARIPRVFAQYWDDVAGPPGDLARLMGSWGRLYPRFDLRRFDDARARAFLARFHPAEVQAAYHRSRQPAQKADIFRLAYLYSQGGFYADADDRLVGDLEELRFPGAGLVLYQEDIGTIGNNLIGAVPGHPLIGGALRSAVEAINRGDTDILWLSTGPGMLTRAFAGLLADPGREPLAALDDAVVLEHAELQRTVSIHCLVGYKNTERHWSRTAFARRAAAAAGRPAPPPAVKPGAGDTATEPAAAAQ